jgi:hypothetical protein
MFDDAAARHPGILWEVWLEESYGRAGPSCAWRISSTPRQFPLRRSAAPHGGCRETGGSPVDCLVGIVDDALRTLAGVHRTGRPSPATGIAEAELDHLERSACGRARCV